MLFFFARENIYKKSIIPCAAPKSIYPSEYFFLKIGFVMYLFFIHIFFDLIISQSSSNNLIIQFKHSSI